MYITVALCAEAFPEWFTLLSLHFILDRTFFCKFPKSEDQSYEDARAFDGRLDGPITKVCADSYISRNVLLGYGDGILLSQERQITNEGVIKIVEYIKNILTIQNR